MKPPYVLEDGLNNVAIGALLKNRRTGEVAVIVDFAYGTGAPMIASASHEIDASEWIVTHRGSEDYDDLDGFFCRQGETPEDPSQDEDYNADDHAEIEIGNTSVDYARLGYSELHHGEGFRFFINGKHQVAYVSEHDYETKSRKQAIATALADAIVNRLW